MSFKNRLKKIVHKIFKRFGLVLMKESVFVKKYKLASDFLPLEQLFRKNLHSDFFFVQIGANDGISYDPIYNLVTAEKVRGIVIEPIKDIFARLVDNYQDHPQIKPLNIAIHRDEKEMTIFRVDPTKKNYPEWTKGTPSFNKSHHKLSFIDENDIVEEVVNCISFMDLTIEHNIKYIDLLQIDTEGYDTEIIKMIDFDIIKPKIISFEHGLQQGIISITQFQECQELLLKNKYNMVILENDALAYLSEL